jgi:hypothetical protein
MGTAALGTEREAQKGQRKTEACEQSRLSMVVAESTELGVEQACTGDRGGGRGEGVGVRAHTT